MPSNSRFRCYFGCDNHGTLHHFPKPEFPHLDKFNVWKKILDRGLQEKENIYIYNQVRLCSKHFEHYFISSSHRLTSNAVPTLFLNALPLQPMRIQDVTPTASVEPLTLEPTTSALPEQSLRQLNSETGLPLQPMRIQDVSPAASVEPLTLEPTTSALPKQSLRRLQSKSGLPLQPMRIQDVSPAASVEPLTLEPTTSALPKQSLRRLQSKSGLPLQPMRIQDVSPAASVEPLTLEPTTSALPKKSLRRLQSKSGISSENNKTTKMIMKLKNRISKITSKYKSEKRKVHLAKKLCNTRSFLKIIDNMPEAMKILTTMQLKWKTKPRGRRFSLDEKIISLTIAKQSQKAYKFLRNLFVLPSKRSLNKLLSTLRLKPGINAKIIENLQQAVSKLPMEKRLFTLLFDEIALSPGLYYNGTEIIGFEDFGTRKGNKIADHALVFMIKGIKSKTKQPICFTFCQSATKKDELKNLLKLIIQELTKIGIIIITTICDQATTNVSTIRSLREDTIMKYKRKNEEYRSKAVEIENIKFFNLFDTPHLLKGVRNNFITKDIKYKQNGEEKIAKWEHLKMLLDMDIGEDEIRLVNKLTECHVNVEKINKMKVKFAAQVFSQRVSSAMRFLARHKILPSECEDTADLLLLMDKLFDSFNGHSYRDTAKVLKGCLKNNSPHFQFWYEILPVLESMYFKSVKKNSDGTETIKFEKIPSLQNWIHNIKTFMEMWEYLNEKYNINNIITRNFNQDPLENFFCCIRSNGIRNVNPTCIQFINAFKTLLINNFDSPHSIYANCEKDDNKSIQSLKCLLTHNVDSPNYDDFACEIDSLLLIMNDIKSNDTSTMLHIESKKYVAGYIIKKCKTKIFKKCESCSNDLLRSERDIDLYNYEVDYTKRSLFHGNDAFINLLNEIYFMIITCMRGSPEISFLKEKIIFFINCRCDFDSVITCRIHKADLIQFIINLSIKLIVHSWCTGINRILNGRISKYDENDSIKLQAFKYYKARRKIKKIKN